MINTIKNIRKLNNARLILISNDNNLIEEFRENLSEQTKQISVANTDEEAFEIISNSSFEMIIIDSNLKTGLESFCFELVKIAPMLPKIVLVDCSSDTIDQSIITAINASAFSLLAKPIRYDDLTLSLTMCLNQTKRGDKFEFKEGIYYDEYRDQFYKEGGILIEFTKLEKGLLKLLISRRGEITDYDVIKEIVWKGKNMSIFTMRNVINKIRQKTYYDIIKNYSNRGYIIDEQ